MAHQPGSGLAMVSPPREMALLPFQVALGPEMVPAIPPVRPLGSTVADGG